MRDYTSVLVGSDQPKLPKVEHDALLKIYQENLILTIHGKISPPSLLESWFEKTAPTRREEVFYIFRDGLLFTQHNLMKDGTWHHYYFPYDWSQIDFIEIGDFDFIIHTKSGGQDYRYITITPSQRIKIKEQWEIYQNVGDIPNNIPLIFRDEKGNNGNSKFNLVNSSLNFIKGGFKLVIGLLIWIIGFYFVKEIYHNATGSKETAWQFAEAARADGKKVHEIHKNIFKDNTDVINVYIACVTDGIAPSKAIQMYIAANDYIKITDTKFRRKNSPDVSDSVEIDGAKWARGLVSLVPVENMNGDQQLSEFGATGLFVLGRWMLNNTPNANEQATKDIVAVLQNYYNKIFSHDPTLLDVTYENQTGAHRVEAEYTLDDIADLRDKMFSSCFIRSPF